MLLATFPRISLGHFPTPLEPMPNLSKALGGPNLFIKRDDCTGLATGGNKVRKLEFLMADAIQKRADTIICHGAVQSNFVRMQAAAAAKLGLKCAIVLERRVDGTTPEYDTSANLFLDRLYGAGPEFYCPGGSNMDAEMEKVADQIRSAGGRPIAIPGAGSNAIGSLGYLAGALELLYQANNMNLRIDRVVQATGSCGTQAGLVCGLHACNSGIEVIGVSVRQPKEVQEERVLRLANATADLAGIKGSIPREAVIVDSNYIGRGYGYITEEAIEAILLTARLEGILLDPVYTGKGMAGLIGMIRKGFFKSSENVVFLHTGGSVGLFAYTSQFKDAVAYHEKHPALA